MPKSAVLLDQLEVVTSCNGKLVFSKDSGPAIQIVVRVWFPWDLEQSLRDQDVLQYPSVSHTQWIFPKDANQYSTSESVEDFIERIYNEVEHVTESLTYELLNINGLCYSYQKIALQKVLRALEEGPFKRQHVLDQAYIETVLESQIEADQTEGVTDESDTKN